jgi:hypothetical protein
MTKEKSNKTEGEKSPLSDFRSPIIFLGVLIAALAGIYWLFPQFWDTYWLPIMLIAAGLAIPFLFSPRKFWAGYGWQVGIAPGLAFVLMGIFVWFFGYRENALWEDAVRNLILTNSIILAVWLVLVMFAYGIQPHGRLWRDYGWILSPAVMVLIFLFSVSWAKSTLEINALEKSNSIELTVPNSNLKVRVVYPRQIIYGEQNTAMITLWLESDSPCGEKSVSLSADHLFFALQPTDSSPLQWQQKITTKIPPAGNPLSIYIRPRSQDSDTTQEVGVKISVNNVELQDSASLIILLEGKGDAQSRLWKNSLLDASSISVVIGIVAAWIEIRRKEEEKKRQKTEQVESAISKLENDVNEDLSKTLQELWNLTANWNEWDKALQDQFRRAYSTFVEQKLWDALAAKTLVEITSDVYLCLQICERIFDDKEEKPISTLIQLQSALRQDGKALLSLVRDYLGSITVAKRIARNYPKVIKDNIVREFSKEYEKEIKRIGDALDFLSEEYPLLQSLFSRYTIIAATEGKLREWLNLHKLTRSPFADASTPFTPLSEDNKTFLVDLTSTGFSFDRLLNKQVHFKFSDAWDLRAAFYRFCKTLPKSIASKAFLVLITPFLIIDFEKESALNLVLHALGEQWLITIAHEPTIYYDLNIHQQKMLARLLCWHYGSSHSVLAHFSKEIDYINSLASRERQQPNHEERKGKNVKEFFKKAPNWLADIPSSAVYAEEIPYLLDLRPSFTQYTFLLLPSVDLDFQSGISVPPEKYDAFDTIVDRLNVHNYTFVHFYLANQRWWRIDDEKLTGIVNDRIRHCAMQSGDPSEQINALNELFIPHDKEEAEKILAQKADGSPGRMVRLGQKLLMQHVEWHSSSEPLHIEDLIDLEL